MSVYSNQFNVNMAEASTLIFNHQMNVNSEQAFHQTVAMVTVPNEVLREMYRVIGDTLKQYDEQAKERQKAAN